LQSLILEIFHQSVQENRSLLSLFSGARFTTDLSYVRLHFCHTVYVNSFTTVNWTMG